MFRSIFGGSAAGGPKEPETEISPSGASGDSQSTGGFFNLQVAQQHSAVAGGGVSLFGDLEIKPAAAAPLAAVASSTACTRSTPHSVGATAATPAPTSLLGMLANPPPPSVATPTFAADGGNGVLSAFDFMAGGGGDVTPQPADAAAASAFYFLSPRSAADDAGGGAREAPGATSVGTPPGGDDAPAAPLSSFSFMAPAEAAAPRAAATRSEMPSPSFIGRSSPKGEATAVGASDAAGGASSSGFGLVQPPYPPLRVDSVSSMGSPSPSDGGGRGAGDAGADASAAAAAAAAAATTRVSLVRPRAAVRKKRPAVRVGYARDGNLDGGDGSGDGDGNTGEPQQQPLEPPQAATARASHGSVDIPSPTASRAEAAAAGGEAVAAYTADSASAAAAPGRLSGGSTGSPGDENGSGMEPRRGHNTLLVDADG
ncbi:unnamed protein product, partial [Phaeothamnion confervicola]